jgi:formiminotetrahydrofolate cyclodeaminase
MEEIAHVVDDMAMPGPYLELTSDELLDRLIAPEPGPGASSVAALTLAYAAGLVTMVARRSRGSWDGAAGAAAQAQSLRRRAAQLVDPSAEVWADALAALASPDGELEAKLLRSAELPLQIGEAAADVAQLALLVAERGDGTYRSDAAVAAVLAEAVARAAEKLVTINLAIGRDDERRDRAGTFAALARAATAKALEAGP